MLMLTRAHLQWCRHRSWVERRHVNEQGVRIRVVNELQKRTVVHFLESVWPKLEAACQHTTSARLADALRDVTNQVR